MRRRVLVLGAGGLLGRAVVQQGRAAGIEVEGRTRKDLDVSDRDALRRVLAGRHDWVINCAAWTDVDAAEAHPEDAMRVNGTAVEHLAELCHERGVGLCHVSSDYVFAGDTKEPYDEDAAPAPINVYGRTKLAGERAIQQICGVAIIVRTSWIFGAGGRCFPTTIAAQLAAGHSVRVVRDQVGRPTEAAFLARTMLALIERGVIGTVHVAGAPSASWLDVARVVGEAVGGSPAIEPCLSADRPTRAPRPSFSVLSTRRAEAWLGPMEPWQPAVAALARELVRTLPHREGLAAQK